MHGGASHGDGSVRGVGVGGMGEVGTVVVCIGKVVFAGMGTRVGPGMETRVRPGMRTRIEPGMWTSMGPGLGARGGTGMETRLDAGMETRRITDISCRFHSSFYTRLVGHGENTITEQNIRTTKVIIKHYSTLLTMRHL